MYSTHDTCVLELTIRKKNGDIILRKKELMTDRRICVIEVFPQIRASQLYIHNIKSITLLCLPFMYAEFIYIYIKHIATGGRVCAVRPKLLGV